MGNGRDLSGNIHQGRGYLPLYPILTVLLEALEQLPASGDPVAVSHHVSPDDANILGKSVPMNAGAKSLYWGENVDILCNTS